VVGIYGKWGEGKTSVKNILKNEILEEGTFDTEILEFNPWHWSNSKNYLKTFVKEPSNITNRSGNLDRELSEKLVRYSDYLSFTSQKVEDLSINIGKIFFFLSFTLGLASIKLSPKISSYTIAIAIILFLLSQSLKLLNWIAKAYVDFKNLEEQK